MAEELKYNTPQDKLLIMLLERISSLEDKHDKLCEQIKKTMKTSHIFGRNPLPCTLVYVLKANVKHQLI